MGRYICEIKITVLGPLLTAAAGGGGYGLDKAFHRDAQGHLVIPASHIKGKVRMALEELEPHFPAGGSRPEIVRWFGVGSDGGDFRYAPARGLLTFSDLSCETAGSEAKRTRVTIHPETRTALDKQLRELEEPYASGMRGVWKGTVTFYAEDAEKAQATANAIQVGLRWLTTLGGEKGVGYGRIVAASVSRPELEAVAHLPPLQLADSDSLHLRITPLTPVLVGEGKNRRTNYIESKHEFAGGVIKGALATCLNQAYGVEPVYRALDEATIVDYPKLAALAALVKHFSVIRITHAFPVQRGRPRPVRKPISTVQQGETEWDTALTDDAIPLPNGQAPSYFVDWKAGESYWGAAVPEMIYETRVEIEDDTQRALEGQLFTYAFCCPQDEEGNDLEWICNVSFAGVDSEERAVVKRQFGMAVQQHLRHLGKLGRAIQVSIVDEAAPNAQRERPSGQDEIVLITLQSDALMLEAAQVGLLAPGEDLSELYRAFWAEIAREDGLPPCLELVDFYAHQGFRGGYLYHRYLGAGEQVTGSGRYRPYYLTRAGSVFKLRVRDQERAAQLLMRWRKRGLPWPAWAMQEFGQAGRRLWENCPFVPENGYGEIAVNLAWHWDGRI